MKKNYMYDYYDSTNHDDTENGDWVAIVVLNQSISSGRVRLILLFIFKWVSDPRTDLGMSPTKTFLDTNAGKASNRRLLGKENISNFNVIYFIDVPFAKPPPERKIPHCASCTRSDPWAWGSADIFVRGRGGQRDLNKKWRFFKFWTSIHHAYALLRT